MPLAPSRALATLAAASVVAVSLLLGAQAAAAVSITSDTFTYTGPVVPIPDAGDLSGANPGAAVSAPTTVAGLAGVVSDVNLSIDGTSCSTDFGSPTVGIDHSFVSDLTLTLRAPDGTTVTVLSNVGGLGNNLCQMLLDDSAPTSVSTIVSSMAPFSGTYRPSNPLSAFTGVSPNGIWTLIAQDDFSADTGNIRAYSLQITTALTAPSLALEVAGPDGVFVPVASGAQFAVSSSTPTSARWTMTNTTGYDLTGYYLYGYGPDCLVSDLTIAAGASYSCTEVVTGGGVGFADAGGLGGLYNGADYPVAYPVRIHTVEDSTGAAVWLSDTTFSAGDTLTITGAGFDEGDTLTAIVRSTPIDLGSLALTGGAFSRGITLPADIGTGTHTVTIYSNGVAFAVRNFTVANPAAALPARLAATGVSGELALTLGGLLLAAGALVMVGARMRRYAPAAAFLARRRR